MHLLAQPALRSRTPLQEPMMSIRIINSGSIEGRPVSM